MSVILNYFFLDTTDSPRTETNISGTINETSHDAESCGRISRGSSTITAISETNNEINNDFDFYDKPSRRSSSVSITTDISDSIGNELENNKIAVDGDHFSIDENLAHNGMFFKNFIFTIF